MSYCHHPSFHGDRLLFSGTRLARFHLTNCSASLIRPQKALMCPPVIPNRGALTDHTNGPSVSASPPAGRPAPG